MTFSTALKTEVTLKGEIVYSEVVHKNMRKLEAYAEEIASSSGSVAAARLEATGAPSRAIIKPAKPVHWLRLTTA